MKKAFFIKKHPILTRFRILWNMLTSDQFIFINMTPNPDQKTNRIEPIILNGTPDEFLNVIQAVRLNSIEVVYGDCSQATRIMKTLHPEPFCKQTLAN